MLQAAVAGRCALPVMRSMSMRIIAVECPCRRICSSNCSSVRPQKRPVSSFSAAMTGNLVLQLAKHRCYARADIIAECDRAHEPRAVNRKLFTRSQRGGHDRAAGMRLRRRTIYTRMNRWSKNGVLDHVFELLQREQIVRIKIEAVKMDSTIVKVHPDGTGALKKTDLRPSENPAADGPPRFIWLPRMLERP